MLFSKKFSKSRIVDQDELSILPVTVSPLKLSHTMKLINVNNMNHLWNSNKKQYSCCVLASYLVITLHKVNAARSKHKTLSQVPWLSVSLHTKSAYKGEESRQHCNL